MEKSVVDKNTALLTCNSLGRLFSDHFIIMMDKDLECIDYYCCVRMQVWVDTVKSLVIKQKYSEERPLSSDEWIHWFFLSSLSTSTDVVGDLAPYYDKLMLMIMYDNMTVKDAMFEIFQLKLEQEKNK